MQRAAENQAMRPERRIELLMDGSWHRVRAPQIGSPRVYYAHCQAIYGTKQEKRDIATLLAMGFIVSNPAQYDQDMILRTQKAGHNVMTQLFLPAVEFCDMLAFRALPDGRIPAGVAMEIEHAESYEKPILELPSNRTSRVMTHAQTIEYLYEVGER